MSGYHQTATQGKRAKFPARYARKDARNKIYRAVYGSMVRDNGERDERYCDYQNAMHAYQLHKEAAALPFWMAQQVEQDIERLKRKGGENG